MNILDVKFLIVDTKFQFWHEVITVDLFEFFGM